MISISVFILQMAKILQKQQQKMFILEFVKNIMYTNTEMFSKFC